MTTFLTKPATATIQNPPGTTPLSDAQLASQIAGQICSGCSAADRQAMLDAISNVKLHWNVQVGCAGAQPGTGSLLASEGGKVAATAGVAALGAALGVATGGIGALAILPFTIMAHHTQAVQRENATLCQIVPQINQTLADIIANFNAGQITADQAAGAFQQLYARAQSALSGITKTCNASCKLLQETQAIGNFYTVKFKNIEAARAAASPAAQAAAALGITPGAPGSTGKTVAIAGAAGLVGLKLTGVI